MTQTDEMRPLALVRRCLRNPIYTSLAIGGIWFYLALRRAATQPIIYDANGYLQLAQAIAYGPDHSQLEPTALKFLFDIRLMGYPIFLVPFVKLGLTDQSLRASVAVVQLVLYIAATMLLRRAIAVSASKPFADRVTIALLVTPFPYFLMVEVLADSLSITLAISTAAALILVTHATLRPRRSSLHWLALALGSTGAALVLRTDGMYVAGLCFAGVFAAEYRRCTSRSATDPNQLPANESQKRTTATRFKLWWLAKSFTISGLFVSGAILLFRVPHYIALRNYSGKGHLSTPVSLPNGEFDYGVTMFKYATGLGEVPSQIPYRNPLLTPGAIPAVGTDPMQIVDNAFQWYANNPLRTLAIVPLKWFALLDQDLPFVYNSEIPTHPSVPLFLINHLVVILGLAGLWEICRRSLRGDATWLHRAITITVSTGGLVWLATHTVPHVEARYGVPALMGLAACAGYHLRPSRIRATWRRELLLLAVYLPIAWYTSMWIAEFRFQPFPT